MNDVPVEVVYNSTDILMMSDDMNRNRSAPSWHLEDGRAYTLAEYVGNGVIMRGYIDRNDPRNSKIQIIAGDARGGWSEVWLCGPTDLCKRT